MFLQILPSELRDVVSKPIQHIADGVRLVDDSAGFQSLDDAIANSQVIGSRLLGYVKAENLFFFFGESIQSLQAAFFRFSGDLTIPVNAADFCGPVYKEQDRCRDENKRHPLAVVLCKVRDVQPLKHGSVGEEEERAGDGDCRKVSWCELQGIENVLKCGHVVYMQPNSELTRTQPNSAIEFEQIVTLRRVPLAAALSRQCFPRILASEAPRQWYQELNATVCIVLS